MLCRVASCHVASHRISFHYTVGQERLEENLILDQVLNSLEVGFFSMVSMDREKHNIIFMEILYWHFD